MSGRQPPDDGWIQLKQSEILKKSNLCTYYCSLMVMMWTDTRTSQTYEFYAY
jgi:hypothetical protein